MRIEQSSHQGSVVLTLIGRLDLAAAPQIQRAILKQLAEQPPAIICDLGRMETIDPLCAEVFTSIQHPAFGWPGTALVLSGTRPAVAAMLVRQGVTRRLVMYPSLDQALNYVRHRPPQLLERLALDPVPTAAGAGRAFVVSVPGEFGSFGHDYRADMVRFVRDAYGLPGSTELQLSRIEQILRSLELERAERIKARDPEAAPSPPAHRTGDGASAAGVPLRTKRTRGARWALRRPAHQPDTASGSAPTG